ncbi:molybdopterin-dependent oxidoreductase [Albimonas sp. CAU 1670]|uniref:xanthine dehydrogenase family protein molybdopterin-binding subunit n=1 Tax=Albimonas sp. CAU 1670 TaxID=3032599 RepID=UPI0023DB048B|nr:molybdopterin cofactor-binding domain-containing protein [Albimonas sp. CAU 1670]MDF2231480.1 molybdopterin-dependent oxidoreductase [Albimonas sp. CAU 1670]
MTYHRNPITRRGFLVRTGAAGAALTMGYAVAGTVGGAGRAAASTEGGMISPSLFFDIHADGRVTIHIAKAEMGQHVGTALAQSVAEELDCGWENVDLSYVGFDPRHGLILTGGSWSVNWTFDALSRAGAAGRMALIEMAAETLGGKPEDYSARDGVISGNGKSITYGELAASGGSPRSFSKEEMAAIQLKPASERRIVGTEVAQLDVPSKTDGTGVYGIDVKLPNMVVATPAPPPVRYGAKVTGVDETEAAKVPGYVKHVVVEDPLGVQTGWVMAVAETYWAASRAAKALNIDYDAGPNAAVSLADVHAESLRLIETEEDTRLFVDDGDVEAGLAEATTTLTADYTTGVNVHAPLEPMNATVEIRDGVYHIHAGNQFQTLMTGLVGALGVAPEKIVFRQCLLGGGFGRRLDADYVVMACHTARALDRPVKLIYSREVDTLCDFTRPSATVRLTAGLKDGQVVAWKNSSASAWASARQAPAFLTPDLSGDPEKKLDAFAINGADHWYTMPNQRALLSLNTVAQAAMPPGHLRSVGPGWQFWAGESFLDEIAAELGEDPLALRLRLLDGAGKNAGEGVTAGGAKRLARVLQHVADASGYAEPRPEGTAVGLACVSAQERASASWTACAAEVSVDASDGTVTVKRLTLATDVGTAVNPGGVRAQLIGAALWGLSIALHEDVGFENGAIQADNFDGLTPLRMWDMPQIEVAVLDSGAYPTGCGEPGVTAVAPAIGNAVARATGARVRSLPITAEKVMAALKA